MARFRVPPTTLTCCPGGQRYVYLGYGSFGFEEPDLVTPEAFFAYIKTVPPKWRVNVGSPLNWEEERRGSYVPPIAMCCPFCAASVPAVVLRKDLPNRIMTIIDGGYYCFTCEARLDSCRCAHPDELWEAVP
jgi:hypothetical protein